MEGGLWRRLVEQLAKEKPLDEALLAAARTAEVTAPPSTYLPLYPAQHYITISQYNYITISQYYNISILQCYNITRWAQQAQDTAPDHPLATVFWQRFFQLLLARPPPQHGRL